MFNHSNRSYRKSLISYTLLSFVITSFSLTSESFTNLKSTQIFAQARTYSLFSLWPSRPKRRKASRGNDMCSIAPAASTETYIVWHNRPLFLWKYSGANQNAELIVSEYDNPNNVIWQSPVNLTAQKLLYGKKKALEADKLYKWQLVSKSKGVNTPTVFQIMPTSERGQIEADLLALEKSLKASKASSEEIALKKANYFANYQIKRQTNNQVFNPWSDVLQSLYDIENPSAQYTQLREEYTGYFCSIK
jgi:hypothetical protein